MSAEPRRAIVLRHSDAESHGIEVLTQQHNLHVVFTVTADTAVPRLAVTIAAQHALDHRAEVVVVPHLTAEDVSAAREWQALAELRDVVISGGVVIDRGTTPARP